MWEWKAWLCKTHHFNMQSIILNERQFTTLGRFILGESLKTILHKYIIIFCFCLVNIVRNMSLISRTWYTLKPFYEIKIVNRKPLMAIEYYFIIYNLWHTHVCTSNHLPPINPFWMWVYICNWKHHKRRGRERRDKGVSVIWTKSFFRYFLKCHGFNTQMAVEFKFLLSFQYIQLININSLESLFDFPTILDKCVYRKYE